MHTFYKCPEPPPVDGCACTGNLAACASSLQNVARYSLDAFVMVVTRAVSLVTLRKAKETARLRLILCSSGARACAAPLLGLRSALGSP